MSMSQQNIPEENNSLHIRPYTPEDFSAIHRIDQTGHEFPWSEGGLRDCLGLGHYCWVLERGPEIEAFVIFSIAAQESEIWNLCVSPYARRQGHARLLLKHVFEFLREKGVDMMFLEVRVSNKPAQVLYHSLGFNELSTRKDYYRYHGDTREDALVLALAL
jgi:[ribosomal protein S18]-alanine N-acetyltransferase